MVWGGFREDSGRISTKFGKAFGRIGGGTWKSIKLDASQVIVIFLLGFVRFLLVCTDDANL